MAGAAVTSDASSASVHLSRLLYTEGSCSPSPSRHAEGLGLNLPAASTAAESRGLSVNVPVTSWEALLSSPIRVPGSQGSER